MKKKTIDTYDYDDGIILKITWTTSFPFFKTIKLQTLQPCVRTKWKTLILFKTDGY